LIIILSILSFLLADSMERAFQQFQQMQWSDRIIISFMWCDVIKSKRKPILQVWNCRDRVGIAFAMKHHWASLHTYSVSFIRILLSKNTSCEVP
jgi:hypothetical protein